MFQWIKNLFRKPERYDTYTPSEKMIFTYFNGKKWVQGDPLAIFCRLKEVWGDLSVDIKVARSPMNNSSEGHKKAIEKMRKIFAVAPLSDGVDASESLTDTQCVDLLDTFLTFTGSLKKNSSQIQTSATEASPSIESSSTANQTTTNTVASGSTENETPIENPRPSVLEQASLSDQSAPD